MKPQCSTHLTSEIQETTPLLANMYTFQYGGDFEVTSEHVNAHNG